MCHALILDDDMIIGRAIQNRLASLGFDSFDHTWTESQACEAAALRAPDLVVAGKRIVGGSPLDAAQRVAVGRGTPILVIVSDRCELHRQLPEGASLSGPFHLSEIETAVELARGPHAMAA
jgi:DNA-binding response OmpR family regulator